MNEDELDIDNISDDDIDAILASIEDGSFDETSDENSNENSDEENNDSNQNDSGEDEDNLDDDSVDDADDDSDDDINNADEDTDQSDDSDDDSQSDDQDDGSDDDNDDDSDDDDGENTPVDDDDNKDESDDSSDTNDKSDGDDQDTAKIDPEEFSKYKDFYDKVVNAEFVANGRKVKGFSDPEKIIQSQQMSYGFSDKMAGFKQYKPFNLALKEAGMLENPDKFNLMMSIAKGDKEALKQHIKTLELDPVADLDIENINYSNSNHLASNESIALDEALESAKTFGVDERLKQVIGKEWDDASFQEFVNDPETRGDLIDHLQTGAYDLVQDKISELKRTDVRGTFTSMKSVDQYRAAVRELQSEAKQNEALEAERARAEKAEADAARVEEEKRKILEERKAQEYKQKAAKQNAKVNESRKQASSVSKKKAKAKPVPKFDPLALDGDDLDALVESMINGDFK